MSDNQEDQNFSFVGDSLNESLIKSMKGGKIATPKVDISKMTLSSTGEVIPKQPKDQKK